MADPSINGSEPEELSSRNPNGVTSAESHVIEQKKTCADCGTSKTPLWRGGPAGPKSLCNACGIRSRKKRRAILGVNKGSSEDKKGKRSITSNNSSCSSGNSNTKMGDSFNQRLLGIGRQVMRQRSSVERQRKKLGEVEQAAVLLMALSYGSVYA